MILIKTRESFSYLRRFPVNFESSQIIRFNSIKECIVNDSFIYRFKNILVCQYYLFSGNRMLEDFCLPIQKRGRVNVLKQWIKLQLFPKLKVNEALWVTDIWSKNYFHWMLESLPRVLVARKFGIQVPILIPAHIYEASYVKASLEDFGVEAIPFSFRQTILVENLYLPSHDSPCEFDPESLQNLIQKYLEIDQTTLKVPFRKLFISRKDANKRRISNETELLPILEELGFEVIQMEKLSFLQQRNLMRETKVLFSIHGAGLSNMIFLPQEAKVIELHPDTERYNSCFYHLASAIGLDYYYSFEKGNHLNPQEADITVDLENIKNLLSSI